MQNADVRSGELPTPANQTHPSKQGKMANRLCYLWRFHRQRKLARFRKRFPNHHSKRMSVRADAVTLTTSPVAGLFYHGPNNRSIARLNCHMDHSIHANAPKAANKTMPARTVITVPPNPPGLSSGANSMGRLQDTGRIHETVNYTNFLNGDSNGRRSKTASAVSNCQI